MDSPAQWNAIAPDFIGANSFPVGTDSAKCRLSLQAKEKLLALFGEQRFSDGQADRERLAKTTLPRSTMPLGVVWPNSLAEVSKLMPILTEHQIPWHAISRGKNWGYGDACAPHDGHLIIDLRQMNRILEINEELAFAVIEPGVSQGQLADELIKRNSRLMLDVTGAGPDASIVGNALQRGFGHTPYGDRTAHTCNYEAVLPDGSVTRTGFGNVTESAVGHVYTYGNGPCHQGMLAQNNAAVVTRMTIWLMPRPESIVGFAFKTDDPNTFAKLVDGIGRLRQDGTIDGVVHLANDIRVLSTQPLMNEAFDQAGPLEPSLRSRLCRRAGIARWNGLGGLFGSRRMVAARKHKIRSSLNHICPVRFFNQRHVSLLNRACSLLPSIVLPERFRNLTSAVTDVYDLLNGKPSPNHLQGAFYRNRPDSGQIIDAGLIWIAPVVPFRGREVHKLISMLESIANEHGFDLPVTVSPVLARAAVCVTNLSFDKQSRDQCERASRCYRELRAAMKKTGSPPYRVSSVSVATQDHRH